MVSVGAECVGITRTWSRVIFACGEVHVNARVGFASGHGRCCISDFIRWGGSGRSGAPVFNMVFMCCGFMGVRRAACVWRPVRVLIHWSVLLGHGRRFGCRIRRGWRCQWLFGAG